MTRFLKIPETQTETHFCHDKKIITHRIITLDNIVAIAYRDGGMDIDQIRESMGIRNLIHIQMSPEDYNGFINHFHEHIIDTTTKAGTTQHASQNPHPQISGRYQPVMPDHHPDRHLEGILS